MIGHPGREIELVELYERKESAESGGYEEAVSPWEARVLLQYFKDITQGMRQKNEREKKGFEKIPIPPGRAQICKEDKDREDKGGGLRKCNSFAPVDANPHGACP